MSFESILTILVPTAVAGLGVLGWMLFWQFWDQHRVKPFGTLVMAATWGAIFTLFLKNFVDDAYTTSASLSFFITVILMEELVKAIAEINAVESTGRKLTQKNDGIFYGVAAALGFIFVETIFYLLSATDFWAVVWGRLIYTAPAHMAFTGIFGMYYGRAYLSSALIGEGKRKQAPIGILGHLVREALDRLPEEKRTLLPSLWAIFMELLRLLFLHITFRHLIFGQETKGHASSELLTEGFLLALYLHLGYDFLLSSSSPILRITGLSLSVSLFAFLLWRFVVLDLRADKKAALAPNLQSPLSNINNLS
jgi:RsiW-degrading membrane proteinase PrsW (M82 family)